MKKLYLCAILASGLWQANALTRDNAALFPALKKYTINAKTLPPPDCTLITPVSATATTGDAALAIDGIGGTRWESEFNDLQSITIDLGASSDVNTVTIDWETANAKDYILWGSVDGTAWVQIAAQNNMPAGVRTDIIADIDAQYRYLKMEGISRNTAYGYSIYEFNVCSTAIVTNPVTCTPVVPVSAVASTGVAALAIDGIGGTRWESDSSDPQSITVDLGALSDVGTVTLDWETANAKDYTLSGSADGTNWVLIATKTDMPAGVRTDVIDEINAQYRYLRMDGISRNTAYGYSIYEFKVCGPSTVTPPVACTPITASTATASTGNALLAIDGDAGSRWESEAADPQSITVDLGVLVDVTTVTLDWETANAKDYVLKGSADGLTWTDIATKTDMPAGVRTDIIENIAAPYRYIKMDGVSRNTPYGYSIYEFKVCGTPVVVPVDCTLLAAVTATATTGNALLATDNNPGSRWESEAADPQSITVDLGEVAIVNTVTLDWETANAKNYTLSGSADGVEWTTIATKTNMPVGERSDIIEGIASQYRYIKMDGTVRNTIYGYSIYEFKVCGSAIATTGIKGFDKEKVVVYPNPAHDVVTIEMKEDSQLSVFNAYGTLIQKLNLKAGKNTMSVAGYAAGLYLIKGDKSVFKLLVK